MNISGPAAVAKPEMLFYAPGDLTVTTRELPFMISSVHCGVIFYAPMMIGTSAAEVMHISMPVQNE